MLDPAFAQTFAHEWVTAWNNHDLPAVLAHYTDDFEMNSPFIAQIAGDPSGRLKGKAAVQKYWQKALTLFPDLAFELLTVLTGAHSITLYYRGSKGRLTAEVFHFNENHQVTHAYAHYATPV